MTPRFRIGVRRPDDHLLVDFEFVNLRVFMQADQGPRLTPLDPAQPCRLIVHFPPQHVAEEAFRQAPAPDVVARSVMANPSRLVFDLTRAIQAHRAIPLTLDALLNWEQFDPVVEPTGADDPGDLTAIELPYRILLAPDAAAVWTPNRRPIESDAGDAVWTELWQARLASRSDDGPAPREPLPGERTVQIVGIRNADLSDPDLASADGVPSRPSSADRRLLPQQSPIAVRRLALSSLGAWADLHGQWAAGDIAEWRQITAMGRDVYVKVATRGYLYPFGHRAILTTIDERRFGRAPDAAEDVAFLESRTFLTVVERDRDYDGLAPFYPPVRAAGPGSQGRDMPFRRVSVLTPQSPTIEFRNGEHLPRLVAGGGLGDPFRFQLAGEDLAGVAAHFTMPLAFIDEHELEASGLAALLGRLEVELSPFSEPALAGQEIAFARPAGSEKTTSFPTQSVRFGGVAAASGSLRPPFLPRMLAATASLPAVDQLLGAQAGRQTVGFRFADAYLESEFDPQANAGQLFAQFVAPSRVDVPLEKSGGMLAPRPNLAGLSRLLGPVSAAADGASSVEESLARLSRGTFNPTSMLGPIKILGKFALTDLIAANAPFDPAAIDAMSSELQAKRRQIDVLQGSAAAGAAAAIAALQADIDRVVADPLRLIQVPMLATHVNREGGRPTSIETEYLWKPKLNAPTAVSLPGLDRLLTLNERAQLVVRTSMRQRFDGGAPESRVSGVLSDFTLSLFGLLDVAFDRITFEMEAGGSPRLVPTIRGVSFGGSLSFVKEIASLLGSDIPFDVRLLTNAIVAEYRVHVPAFVVCIFGLKNLSLATRMTLPLVEGGAIGVRFALSDKSDPFLLSVWWFGGGGFFALEVRSDGQLTCEIALEAGAVVALDVGVAQGEVHAFFGIYFKLGPGEIVLEGYFRIGGSVTILAIASVSIEACIKLSYANVRGREVVSGTATVELCVEVAFFSKCVSFSITKEFVQSSSAFAAGLRALPGGLDVVGPPVHENRFSLTDWRAYTNAFG